MALTGKTISELDRLYFPTNDTLIPVQYSTDTMNIAFSSITYNVGTYSQFAAEASAEVLTPGRYYLMEDYQTCYDQPNYTNEGAAILTGNYKTGTTEPILLLATSTTGFSPTVYSTLYPNDKISYDFTWNTTEVTDSPAKGRITERIDDRNNRADYDFRAVQFIRYQAFLSENYYEGTVSIDGSGNVVGVGTDFINDFSVGQILGIHSPNFANLIGGFAYYEILTIPSTTGMTVTGTTFYPQNTVFYSRGTSGGVRSPFKCNVPTPSYTGSSEYYTFNENQNFNTYLGDNQNYSNFILSNNVFLGGNYEDMTFGGNVVGNTFDNFMTSTTCAPSFQYNIITNNFDRSTIGPDFTFNFIECDFQGNTVVGNFEYNMLGDNDGQDFDFNQVGWGFRHNFLTFANGDFIYNVISNDFNQNVIDSGFARNVIGNNFNNNIITGNFDDNQISTGFNANVIRQNFDNNVLEADVYQNNFLGNFERNTGGPIFYNNNFYNHILENNLGLNFFRNTIGEVNNVGVFNFQYNSFQGDVSDNVFTGASQLNKVGYVFGSNTIATNFSYNQIGNVFINNTIANDFGFGGGDYRGNVIGNGFQGNNIGEYFYDNTIGDQFVNNDIADYFVNNKVSYNMQGVMFGDYDSSGHCENNNFTFIGFTGNYTLSGGTGGNPIFYTTIPVNVVLDAADNSQNVTFLSGGTIVAQSTTII
jgi:hypothetical protein